MHRASAALPAIYFTEIPTHNNKVLQQGITTRYYECNNQYKNTCSYACMQGRDFAVNNCLSMNHAE
jgi:hypothetical protein